MVKILKDGTRLYPVCSFEKNQHKLYNAYDRARIRQDEEDYSPESTEAVERVERALSAFNRHVIGNTVYATHDDSALIKDYIVAYDVRGDLAGNWKSD